MSGIDWTELLAVQLDGHWTGQIRPRLDGLTDAEYLWEPVPGMWSVRPGPAIDVEWPEPDPPPVTTIAWRLAHLIVGAFGMRAARHFGGPPRSWARFPYAQTADEALRQLDAAYGRWIAGVRGLDATGLARPIGPGEGAPPEAPMAALVLHVHREAIHHAAEICLLRDLHRARPGR